jgi:hypothetical protein
LPDFFNAQRAESKEQIKNAPWRIFLMNNEK